MRIRRTVPLLCVEMPVSLLLTNDIAIDEQFPMLHKADSELHVYRQIMASLLLAFRY